MTEQNNMSELLIIERCTQKMYRYLQRKQILSAFVCSTRCNSWKDIDDVALLHASLGHFQRPLITLFWCSSEQTCVSLLVCLRMCKCTCVCHYGAHSVHLCLVYVMPPLTAEQPSGCFLLSYCYAVIIRLGRHRHLSLNIEYRAIYMGLRHSFLVE